MNKGTLFFVVLLMSVLATGCSTTGDKRLLSPKCAEVKHGVLEVCTVQDRDEQSHVRTDAFALVTDETGHTEVHSMGATTNAPLGKELAEIAVGNLIPTLGGLAVGLDYNNALRDGNKRALEGTLYSASAVRAASDFAVLNQRPSVIDNSTRTLSVNATGGSAEAKPVQQQYQEAQGGAGGGGGSGGASIAAASAATNTEVSVRNNTDGSCAHGCKF